MNSSVTEGLPRHKARKAILATLPFLVQGALSLAVLRAMRDRGFDVTIAFYMPEAVGYSRDSATDFEANERLTDMTMAPGLSGVEKLEHIIRSRNISLLLQIGAPEAYNQIPYLKERLPHLHVIDTLYNPIGHTVSHFLYENAIDGVLVESVAMRNYVMANTTKATPTVHLVLSGIALEGFIPSVRQREKLNIFTLGYVGRMSPEKNPMGFLELAEHLSAEIPALRFRIFGEGGMATEVRARVAASPAAAAITFDGYAAHARDGLHVIDVLVVPSKLDGRPNAIMEANACGVPVIGAPVGGIPELIEDGVNGYLAEPSDHSRIENLVRSWLGDPEAFVRLRRTSRAKAEREFDRNRMLDDYATVFATAIRHSAGEKDERLPAFQCSVCGGAEFDRRLMRGDGLGVEFCSTCGMGAVEIQPSSTVAFYDDGYYGGVAGSTNAETYYEDYAFTAEHALLWAHLFIETLLPRGGRVLDVGCADGFLLKRLRGSFELFGIEANATAGATAASSGITLIASDIADPCVSEYGQFDVVSALATLEHVLDIRGAVATCLDLLAPSGILLYEVPLISEVSNNKDWLNGSFEHIYYPTSRAIDSLFSSFSGVFHVGFETEIRGFSASFIGVAARDPVAFARAERLLQAMARQDLASLKAPERRLNLAYHVVHGFRPTPDRVLALPELLEVAHSPGLLKRLTQLWHFDALVAQQAGS